MRDLYCTRPNVFQHVTAALYRVVQTLLPGRSATATRGRAAPAARPQPADNFLLGKRVVVDQATGACTAFDLDKQQAEALLDWLETAGARGAEVRLEGQGFSVRWFRGKVSP